MKKLFVIASLLLACLSASAQNTKMFWGVKGGVFYDAGNTVSSSSSVNEPSTLSFALKPSIGWYLGKNWQVGFKAEFADSKVYDYDSSKLTPVSIRNMISNLTLGNGLGTNYINWKILPYARCHVTKLFYEKVNLWVELELYAGQQFDRNLSKGGFYGPSTIYGVVLSPMVTYDLTDKLMITLTPDLIRWDGSSKVTDNSTTFKGSFSAQFNPLYQVLSGIFNIGVISRF